MRMDRTSGLPFPCLAAALALAILLGGCPDDPLNVGGFCSGAADCPPSQVCAGGLCVGTCTTSDDCGAGEVCQDQVCLPACAAQAECVVEGGAVSRLCLEGVCTPAEKPGVPVAGEPRTVSEGERVVLSASGSTSFDAAATTFTWEQVASNPKGVVVALEAGKSDAVASPDVAFDAPPVLQDTTLLFRLTMTDADGNEAKAEVEITVTNSVNEAPTATATADVTEAHAGDTVTLSAAGSGDPNPFDGLTYAWTWDLDPEDEGVTITLQDASDEGDMSSVSFLAPELPVDTTITFTLHVSDGTDTATTSLAVLVYATVAPTCDPTLCDDDDPCTDDGCIPLQGCTHAPLSDVECDDGDPCTEADTCAEGACVGAAKVCDDGDPCTDDACEAGQCTTTLNKKPCDDGDACTLNDVCKLGACVGTAKVCDDANVCTDDVCEAGECVGVPNTLPCDDGNVCTSQDACAGGTCKGVLKDCDDANPCTNDGCQQGVCNHLDNSAPCDDGNKCTADDQCAFGGCKPGTPIKCDDGNPCSTDACAPGTGCYTTPINAGPCNDGDPCTHTDVCTSGACVGKVVDCDDGNECTHDSCGPKGCENTPNAAACHDDDPCTLGDTCANGVCLPGEGLLACDDGDQCTADACVPLVGCQSEPVIGDACDDGDPCTLEDLCEEGGDCVGVALFCDDGDVCTLDFCQDGECATSPAAGPCEDGDSCTIDDQCAGGECVGGKNPCDDGIACTLDLCDPVEPGACLHPPAPVGTACMDDGGLCSFDGVCRHFEVRSFLPTQPVFPEVRARLTGAMDDPFGGIATSATVAFETGEGTLAAGFIVGLAAGEPHAVLHERYDGGFNGLSDSIAAGDGVVSLQDGPAWYDFFGFDPFLGMEKVLAVAPAAPWYAGGAPSGWSFGLRSPDQLPTVLRCGMDVESGCELAWQGPAPGQVDALYGVWEHTEAQTLAPAPQVAVANGDDGLPTVAWLSPPGVWSTDPPLGCTAGQPGTPCEAPGRLGPAAGNGQGMLWLGGDGGRLWFFDGGAWAPVPLGGTPADPQAYDVRALLWVGGDLWIATETAGCGAGACAQDPTWKAHVLLHRSEGGGYTPARLLAARQCPSTGDPVACAEELALFTIEAAAAKDDGTLAIVGGDLAPQEAAIWQTLLAYLVRLDPLPDGE